MTSPLKTPETVFVCAGSNMGDKIANCREGLAALARWGDTRTEAFSRFYRTAPVDFTDQDWFVNAVARVATTCPPSDLLRRLKAIEAEAGRTAGGVRFGPRVLDLDIIFFGDRRIDLPDLVVPHPRMHKRHFVLKPICDIDPAIVHPVLGQSVGALLGALDVTGQEVSVLPCDS
jgi:2-amino-4-hydroxy-6-hydroxymethyldihydropteridine diphosphokinase